MVEERASMAKEFKLKCRHLDSRIAILEAFFTPNEERSNESNNSLGGKETYPVRLALNKR